jgi:hypothetical protein
MWTADVNDLNIFAFDLHRPSYPSLYQMTAVETTTSRLTFCPISFNNYAHINIMFFPIDRRFSS